MMQPRRVCKSRPSLSARSMAVRYQIGPSDRSKGSVPREPQELKSLLEVLELIEAINAGEQARAAELL